PPKTLKFKPLIAHAQEPSPSTSSAAKRSSTTSRSQPEPTPPLPTAAAAAAISTSRWKSPPRRCTPDGGGGRSGGTSTGSSAAYAERGGRRREGAGAGAGLLGFDQRGAAAAGGGGEGGAEVYFESLQFLEIHSCSGLKVLEGLKCPALAVARVTSCRELISVKLEGASVLSHLDLSGCVRLERWGMLPPPPPPSMSSSSSATGAAASSGAAGSTNLAGLRVVILNYCRALQPKSLGLLVDHARDLHRLEIYGAAVVARPHSHGGGSSKTKKEQSAGKRNISRVEYNRLVAKAAAILKGLDKGRPKLTVVRTKKEFGREQDGAS
ncbi:unnamed protein product, partial [Pylaiella littoralis]